MKARFFTPHIGSKYWEGINGKKILVLGASFYCPKQECPYFFKCTDVNIKDSSEYNLICPEYCHQGLILQDEPSYCIEDGPRTYRIFANKMNKALFDGELDYENFWEHFAFTNYVQFFLPAKKGSFRQTHWSDLSDRDFDAFVETLKEIKPDIVIIWGTIINGALKEHNKYVTDRKTLPKTGGYICHMTIPGTNHETALINPYHPSSSAWHNCFNDFEKYLKELLM